MTNVALNLQNIFARRVAWGGDSRGATGSSLKQERGKSTSVHMKKGKI